MRSLEKRELWLEQAVRRGLIDLETVHSIEKQPNGSLDDGCGIALNMAFAVESEHAVPNT